jgi:hypothetical protein
LRSSPLLWAVLPQYSIIEWIFVWDIFPFARLWKYIRSCTFIAAILQICKTFSPHQKYFAGNAYLAHS